MFLFIYVWFMVQICIIVYYKEFIYYPLVKLKLLGMGIFLFFYLTDLSLSFYSILIDQENVNKAFSSFGKLFFVLKLSLDILELLVYYKTDTEIKFVISIYIDIVTDVAMSDICKKSLGKIFQEMPQYFFNYDNIKIVS